MTDRPLDAGQPRLYRAEQLTVRTASHAASDGRFSGGSSGLAIGHVSPEAAAGGVIGLVEDGDVIEIEVGTRRVELAVAVDVLDARRRHRLDHGGFLPASRVRKVSSALRAYAAMATSADRGAVRDVAVFDLPDRETVPQER